MYSRLCQFSKYEFFQAVTVSMLLYSWTTWTCTKLLEINPYGKCTRMMRTNLNKPWKKGPIKQQHPFKYWLGSFLLNVGDQTRTWDFSRIRPYVFNWLLCYGVEADGINLLLALTLASAVQQRQIWGRKALASVGPHSNGRAATLIHLTPTSNSIGPCCPV